MSCKTKVVLVTGGNKGIGFEIVKKLCNLYDGDVILTARSEERGREAVKKLEQIGLSPKFLQLDITDSESIENAKRTILNKYGHLNVLINNAGLCLTSDMGISLADRAQKNIATNYYGTMNVTREFLPLLQPNGRVVTMGSESANMLGLVGPKIQMRFTAQDITIEKVSELMEEYLEAARLGDTVAKDWPAPDATDDSYCVAEVGRILFSELLAKELAANPLNNVDIVCVVPGWVTTEMGGKDAPDPPESGALSTVFACLLPPGKSIYYGKLINKEKEELNWATIKEKHDTYLENVNMASQL